MPDEQNLLARVLLALKEKDYVIANVVGITPFELRELAEPQVLTRQEIVDVNRDLMWTLLSHYVDQRIGELMSIREEMSRKLKDDRKRQLDRRLAVYDR